MNDIMEEAGASFTEKDKQFLYKTQILFTASKSLALLAIDATPRPCNVSVQLMLSHPCDTLFISCFLLSVIKLVCYTLQNQ
ncbi:hypothetical protein [Bifidobacterium longum]|uniref:hypothetical protein n=1 Tax=Bifidobacterium longum TaxID=216816 RepID=UPI001F604375|nr:hypothetical protein [Bifidobacterium longum]